MHPRLGSWRVAAPNLMKQQTLAAAQMKQTADFVAFDQSRAQSHAGAVDSYEPLAAAACLHLRVRLISSHITLGEKGNKHVSQSFFTQTWSLCHQGCVCISLLCILGFSFWWVHIKTSGCQSFWTYYDFRRTTTLMPDLNASL